VYEPVDKGTDNGLFVSRSYDATSHFETVCDDVKDLYRRINGKDLDFKGKISRGDEDAQ
jgi:Rab GDP dissociation inhibitor